MKKARFAMLRLIYQNQTTYYNFDKFIQATKKEKEMCAIEAAARLRQCAALMKDQLIPTQSVKNEINMLVQSAISIEHKYLKVISSNYCEYIILENNNLHDLKFKKPRDSFDTDDFYTFAGYECVDVLGKNNIYIIYETNISKNRVYFYMPHLEKLLNNIKNGKRWNDFRSVYNNIIRQIHQ